MGEYRLYCIGDDGRFTKSDEIDAKDDDEALALSRKMKLPVKCELWERGRLMAKLSAHKR